jgi:hypothetical protein
MQDAFKIIWKKSCVDIPEIGASNSEPSNSIRRTKGEHLALDRLVELAGINYSDSYAPILNVSAKI